MELANALKSLLLNAIGVCLLVASSEVLASSLPVAAAEQAPARAPSQAQAPAPQAWASDPRVVATELEMANLAEAMELAAIDTGYWTSIENLNDFIAFSPPVHDFDDINDGGGTLVIDPATGRWRSQRKDLRNPPLQWQGPYISFPAERVSVDGAGYDPGTLLDLWGQPYRLFTPLGLARPFEAMISLELYGDAFDRYAIVSLGPDGVKSGDDLIRLFGSPPTALAVSSLSPSRARLGASVRIRGWNFGASQGAGRILLNGRDAGPAQSWTAREIVFIVPAWAQSGAVQVEVGGISSQPPLELTVALSRAGQSWKKYQ